MQSVWVPYPVLTEHFKTVKDCVGDFSRVGVLKETKEKAEKAEKTDKVTLVGQIRDVNSENKSLTLGEQEVELILQFLESIHLQPDLEGEDPWNIIGRGDVIRITAPMNPASAEVWEVRQAEWTLLSPCYHKTSCTSQERIGPKRWGSFIHGVRTYFLCQNYYEADTPYLVDCPGMEPTLDPFRLNLLREGKSITKYLPTSPEISLKKILTQGVYRLFEIKKCFRNNELSPIHSPEFWMLEWYQAFVGLDSVQKELMGLLTYLSHAQLIPHWDQRISIKSISMSELFLKYLDFILQPHTSQAELENLCQREKIHLGSGDHTWNDLFHFLFLEKIEPHLFGEGPLFITHFPPQQSALARLSKEGWAERFEFYWQGMELANAFHEVNDPKEQKKRDLRDQEEKLKLGKEAIPFDESFYQALESGMPPASGIALGMERLFMAAWGIKNIQGINPYC